MLSSCTEHGVNEMDHYAIRTAQLSCHFGTTRAVDDLSMEVPKGIVFGFLGPNGSGKTTTIRLLLGLLEPKQGKAEVLGYDSQKQADQIRNQAGALLEHTGLYERLSAEDNLEFYGRINHLSAGDRRARIQELLTHFDLWDRRQDRVGNWSRGMKQKLAIARALLHHPEIIFLDEPTAGLDPVAAAALREDIKTMVEQTGVTVFLNTHNLPEAEKLCTLVGVIRKGRLLTIGDPQQLRAGKDGSYLHITGRGFSSSVVNKLRAHPMVEAAIQQNSHLELTLSNQGDTSTLVSFLINAGVQIEEVQKNKFDLEDVFLRLMEEEPNAV
jgi:ABC-2 type transport system ATP-binding protein